MKTFPYGRKNYIRKDDPRKESVVAREVRGDFVIEEFLEAGLICVRVKS